MHGTVGGTSPGPSKYSLFLFFFLAQQPVSWACALSAASDSNPSVCMSSVPHQAGGQLGKVRSRAAGGFFKRKMDQRKVLGWRWDWGRRME